MAGLLVVRAGLLTTVQDLGRPGWGAFGVPASGAMDPPAARAANHLVGNPPGAPLLELTGPGAAFRVDEARLCALGGAELGALIDDGAGGTRSQPAWETLSLAPGETLRLSQRRSGARAALAIAGGLAVEPVFGAAATDVTNRLGGWQGRPLRAGDRLPLGDRPSGADAWRSAPPEALLNALYGDPFTLRFVPDPDAAPALIAWLAATAFAITPQSNRVGFRLDPDTRSPPVGDAGGDRVSEPIAPGTLQVPPDGRPILLMADHQTIGGYPVAGHVIAADRSRAAQLWPGDRVRFVPVALPEARRQWRAQTAALARWLAG